MESLAYRREEVEVVVDKLANDNGRVMLSRSLIVISPASGAAGGGAVMAGARNRLVRQNRQKMSIVLSTICCVLWNSGHIVLGGIDAIHEIHRQSPLPRRMAHK